MINKLTASKLFYACLLALISCHSKNGITTKNNGQPSIRFYYRDVGCNNGDCSYGDYIILENYRNNTYTIRQMAGLAISYLDIARADLPITSVTIVGEKPGNKLPPAMTKTYYQHADYQVVSFVFEKTIKASLHTESEIKIIAIWKKGESENSYATDSLLASKELLDNEN